MKYLSALLISLLFTSSIIAATTTGGDNETAASIEATTQKKAGQVVYNCGTTPCEGYKKALYTNGQVQIEGTFKNGIVVDTLKEFTKDGGMTRIFCPDTKNGFEKQFYGNGKIKRIFDNKSNKCTYYYENGKVWLTYTNNAGQRSEITQYYENGQVRLVQNNNTQKAYYTNGKLAYKCKRSEEYKMNRIFSETDVRFFTYEYEAYNEAGVKVTDATFKATEMDFKNGFPLSITEVSEKDFNCIVYYDEAGKPVRKMECELTSNTRYKKVTYVYEFGKWHAFESTTAKLNDNQAK